MQRVHSRDLSFVILHLLKMATCENAPRKKHPRQGPCYQMEVNFPNEDSKKQFMSRLDKAKRLLSFDGLRVVDNFRLLPLMLNYFE